MTCEEPSLCFDTSLLLILVETGEPQWNNEKEVTSQLTLLGLVGIDTVDEYVSNLCWLIGLRVSAYYCFFFMLLTCFE